MNILVTGGAGYIGSHTCVELLNSGYDVTVIDNLCNANPKSLERVEAITGKKVKFYEGDVRDEALLRKIFAENEISAVIHFAGLKAVGESVAQPWRYYDNNLNTTLVLTKVMADVGCKKIIFSSSATVYSGDNEMPLRETSRTGNCTNPYGWTKYMTEQILSGMAFADKEWSVVLLRYFNPIGAHESGMIGEDPRGIPNNLMPYITQVAIGRREKLSIYGNDYPTPDGTGVRDYIHVTDLASAHILAAEYLMNGGENNVFNLGNGVGFTVKEVIDTAEKVVGKPIKCEMAPRRAGDPAQLVASSEKAKTVLGWKPKYDDIETIIGSAWNWHKEHPHGYDNGNCLGGAGCAAGLREKLRPSPPAGRDVRTEYPSF